jgi:hypothetical protein
MVSIGYMSSFDRPPDSAPAEATWATSLPREDRGEEGEEGRKSGELKSMETPSAYDDGEDPDPAGAVTGLVVSGLL